MCWGDLITRDRSQPPNPEHERSSTVSNQTPVSLQPHQHETLQVPAIDESLPVEEKTNISVTGNADDDKNLLANLTMSYQSSPTASDSSPAWRGELANQLRRARIDTINSADFIITMETLDKLITTSVIERAIKENNPNMSQADTLGHAQRIETHAKRLFAIYALRTHGTTLRFLLESDLSDNDLPLIKRGDKSGRFLSRKGSDKRIEAFDDWEDIMDDFARPQWSMIAPFFDRNHLNCLELENERLLPFIPIPKPQNDDDGIPHEKVGGYGEVNAYRIHHEYHNFWTLDKSKPLDSHPLIAVKELLHKDRIEFLREKIMLVALGHNPHPHLIQLLGTYRKLRSYHLIFPCADANLRVYWAKNPMPHFTRDRVLWLIQQIAGISGGLHRIHCFEVTEDLIVEPNLLTPISGQKFKISKGEAKFGRHGDLKAENLLWFKDGNILKITDFGLGRFHSQNSRSNINPRSVVHPLTFEPPESRLGRDVSRKYDIWSMGCLFLEFLTWLLEGNEKIGEFSDNRGKANLNSEINDDNFFTVFSDGREPEVRDSVVQWVNGLHAHRNCSGLIHDLLDFVMKHMLRVDSEERIDASDLEGRMKAMASEAAANEDYLIGLNPRL